MTNITSEVRAVDYHQQLNGVVRQKFFYRCGACRGKKVLNRELWEYTRPPKCECGACDWRIDMSRYKEWVTRRGPYDTCKCDGLPFFHRAGSSVWCEKHKAGPAKKDFSERYN